MIIQTKEYGSVEIDEDRQVFDFVQGIPAFETLRRWALFEAEVKPFFVLQSLEDVSTAFFLLNPWLCRGDYCPALDDIDLNALGLMDNTDENAVILAIITVPLGHPEALSVNLQAPIVFNTSTNQALQAVSNDERWHVRHALGEQPSAGRGVD